MSPSCLCSRASPHDVVRIRAGEIGREGHIEGQVDLRARGNDWRGRRGRRWALDGCCDGHFVVGPREGEAGRGAHLLPAVPSRAGEVGYLVHDGVKGALEDGGRADG